MKTVWTLIKSAIDPFLRPGIAVFLAGVILSAAIDVAIGRVAQSVGVLLIFVIVYILYTIATLESMSSKLERQINTIGLTTEWVPDYREAYKRGIEIMQNARHTILALNPHVPEPPLRMKDERSAYLEAIEQNIQLRLSDPTSEALEYTRILQSDMHELVKIDHRLRKDLINEEPQQTFEHCKKVLVMKIKDAGNRIDLDIRVSKPVPSFPTLFIVDGVYASITLVKLTRQININTDQPEQVIEWSGALFIEDRTGQKIADLIRIFRDICRDAVPIYSVEEGLQQAGANALPTPNSPG